MKFPARPTQGTRRDPKRSGGLLWLYNGVVVVLGLVSLPVLVGLCLFRATWRRGLGHRLGWGWPSPRARPVLWAHAASVGEVEGIAVLVGRWHEENPEGSVLVTALTETGCAVARRTLPFAAVRPFPLDLPLISARVVRQVRPDLFLFSENEIWPNVLATLAEMGVPAVQVSGRLSETAAGAFSRFRSVFSRVLTGITFFCVQSEADRRRLVDLGVDSARVEVTGSLKSDGPPRATPDFVETLRGLGRPVVIAGSTHEGEDAIILAAAHRLAETPRRPLWILAPRHPERFASVCTLLQRHPGTFVRRTGLPADESGRRSALADVDFLLLDSIGELASSFSVATVCFLGGSLVPVGGHNLLEPARHGVPLVVGPHLDSVREIAAELESIGALEVVHDEEGLAIGIEARLEAPADPALIAAERKVSEGGSGSLARTWACVDRVIDGDNGGLR